ncbi:MAG TPA: bifunctional aspartate kinase/homoserine dehydrogenase I [Bacteroidota bacterium]|nr:bifunctional aspartate kinase/homoserine dehydrogenase I [Bacteroidota bacterium]
MKILKFGGTSVGSAENILSVVQIIQAAHTRGDKIVIVSSAMAGVTNQLIEASRLAHKGDESYIQLLNNLHQLHRDTATTLLGTDGAPTNAFIDQAFVEIEDFIKGIWILGELTNRTLDYVVSYGEQLSCNILAAALAHNNIPAEYVDSRKLISTDLNYGSASVNFDLTNWNILNHFRSKQAIQVVTGFIALGPNNETTTLGRGGSDYTASILAAALQAEEIEIWTDVNGVLTADPRKVSNAFSLESLTFEEAIELSHFGAKVIHPPTMLPAMEKNIPIRIRNTFDKNFPGTMISNQSSASDSFPVKGIACIDHASLLKVSGESSLQISGIASRMFETLSHHQIDVLLTTQSSSEPSICIAVAPEDARTARELLQIEFRVELHSRQIRAITSEDHHAVIAIVGNHVQNVPDVIGKVFSALGRNGITPAALSYGSSNRILALAIAQHDLKKAMSALHDQLFLSHYKTLNLFLLGPGLVGQALLELLSEQSEYTRTALHTRINVIGIANSTKMFFDEQGIDLACWRSLLKNSSEPSDLIVFTEKVKQMNAANSVLVDCTGIEPAVQHYLPLLEASVSLVTPSKIANTKSYEFYQRLRETAQRHGAQFRYSTNVCAALPVVESIQNIIHNGDTIEKIEAVLSGTLSFIFNQFNTGTPFSMAVFEAQKRGYSEPDPRIDLSGTDVARKLLILIREAGFPMEYEDIQIDPYLPEPVFTDKDFSAAIQKADEAMKKRKTHAEQSGNALVYLARFQNGKATIGLEEIPNDHPFAHLTGNDNIVALTTRTLYRQPLVVRGGGAGAQLTAAGIFNDLLFLSHSIN